jgi:hypothetical protein
MKAALKIRKWYHTNRLLVDLALVAIVGLLWATLFIVAIIYAPEIDKP